MARELPPVPEVPVRPPQVVLTGEARLRVAVAEDVELDARMTGATDARGVAVVCHPHPLYGGTMHSAMVVAIAKALAESGIATLRFDFRGVGASSGRFDDTVGETDDVAAMLAEASRRWPSATPLLAGYSFGAACALKLALGRARVAHPMPKRVALVAPSPRLFGLDGYTRDHERSSIRPSTLIVAPSRDEFADIPDVRALAERIGARLEVVEGDHMLVGARRRVAELVAEHFASETSDGLGADA